MTETFEQYTARLLALAEGAEPLEVLASTPRQIADRVAGRSTTDLQSAPGPGRWSVAQIVSHLADSEVVFAYRMRMILSAPGTPIQAFNQDAWCDAQHAGSADAFEKLTLF